MTEAATGIGATAGRSLWGEAWRRLRRNRAAVVALVILGAIATAALLGPALSPWPIDEVDWDAMASAPGLGHPFGTDANGRDMLARVLFGGRISLLVGLAATLVSVVIGIAWGATAGYLGGRSDAVMMRIVDILYALPFMFFVILLMVYFGRHIVLIFVAIGVVEWLDMARIVRGQALSLKQKEFVEAAKAVGTPEFTIVRRHIVPNTLGPVTVFATLTVPKVILFESFLSFLGLGVQEPMTSWGVLISEGATQMETAPWTLIFPTLFLAVTLFCLNFIGDGLRDALDTKQR
ncbi:MAG: ABC transporter permease subunit [Alphaproteobacteria bacterium]|jgi:oligopeptide transport system permease protein|nr:ABC transporter permease subunit [Alphaproteobacteria bacterium]MDP6621545.1 ABC transporter permease subunit [Alphaproteobacteria bacterium]|tara:strand:- start:92 stop:967 length:876 start_codon:yes stop_codon:yes gene_type:complete